MTGSTTRDASHSKPQRLRLRLASIAIVAIAWLATRLAWPDPFVRGQAQVWIVTTLGYGHLLGAVVFGRARIERARPRGASRSLWWCFLASALAAGYVAMLGLLHVVPGAVGWLLAASLWHTIENDRALAVAPGAALGPIRWPPFGAAVGLAAAGLIVAAASVLEEALAGAEAFTVLFFVSTLYHLVSWGLWSAAKIRRCPDAALRRNRWGWLAVVHLAPAMLCALAAFGSGPLPAALAAGLFSAPLYLYFSAAHVAQTAWLRGFARPAGSGNGS